MTRVPKAAEGRSVFRIPLLVGLASLAGLLSALFFEGPGWVAAWIGLGLPLALVAWHVGLALIRTERTG
ncbi:MAG: hypothetical protein K2X71_07775 [Methylobacterium sp.]|uniref:hypothetical protein n=1 Tax=Methylobacterium sp. TaxID=409 RepID=UPI0025852D29|nr:hypothetical protein [Methylobacterium sp.]MBY0295920.1 hypothetical protein [Methylobacterium sp.]